MWDCVVVYLVYHVDEALSVISREALDHLNLFTIREDRCYQRSTLVHGKGIADQPFPGGKVTT